MVTTATPSTETRQWDRRLSTRAERFAAGKALRNKTPRQHIVRGKAPQKDIDSQQINERVRPTHQAVTKELPECAAPGT